MKNIFFVFVVIVFFSCKSQNIQDVENQKTTKLISNNTDSIPLLTDKVIYYYASLITKEDLKKHVISLTSDAFQGRRTGEKGQKIATEYLVDYYKSKDIAPAFEKT